MNIVAFSEVGARNERRICAINCNKTAGFEIVHGLLDKIMLLLEVPWNPQKGDTGYYLRATSGKGKDIILIGKRMIYNTLIF